MTDYLHRCFILTLVHLSCSPSHLIAKSCLAMQTFPSVSPVYDSLCMTWTVYWTLILCRLPTLIQPALLFDYPDCLPPALIISPNSDFDSALSTFCLKLVIEFCLFDLHSVLIKLHMDTNATDLVTAIFCEYVRQSILLATIIRRITKFKWLNYLRYKPECL